MTRWVAVSTLTWLGDRAFQVGVELEDITAAAVLLVQDAESNFKAEEGRSIVGVTVSGDYRRFWVLSNLILRFPNRRQRDLSLAIEIALRRIRSRDV